MAQARTPGPDQPSSARITNYLLGGHDNTAADRAKAAELEAVVPELRQMAKDSRLFTARAAAWAAGQGIRQVVDLGCGLPAGPALHDAARSVAPAARVAYVDDDAEVTDYLSDVMLVEGGREGIAVVSADLRDPAAVLSDPALLEVIDPSEPVCLVLTLVLHSLPPWKARQVVCEYMRLAVPGSAIAISTPRVDDQVAWKRLAKAYPAAAVSNFTVRQLRTMLRGLELVPPGVCAAAGLRPGWADCPCGRRPENCVIGGIGRKA